MGEQMRSGSCCAKIQGELSKVSIAPPATLPNLAYAVNSVVPVPAPLMRVCGRVDPPAPSASYQHPLQI
jgi:hypothetical protein